ncbi:hypothetical protein [Sphingomonas hankookensis]|uniref:hypothetical protein n=1 Tax=Sphingomonas hankookensis TaxID=563996 RepID=UPI003D3028B0
MALDAKLLAVVQTIGADIKALFARVMPTIARTTATQASTSTSLTAIANLAAPLVAGATYRITGRVIFQSSGLAVGATMGFVGPAGSNALLVIAIPATALISTGTATVRTSGAAGSGSTTSVVAANTSMVATFDGVVTVGSTAGSFALQFATSGVGTVTVQPGSVLVVEKLL